MEVFSSIDEPVSERMFVRYGVTLAANLVRAGLTFATGLLIARGLGPENYGDLNFLLGSFVAIGQLLEVGTASAFYTFLSQKRRGTIFFLLYIGWVVFQLVAPLFVIGVCFPGVWLDRIWVGHERNIILLAFIASFCSKQLWGMIQQLGEALRKTVVMQIAAVVQAGAHVLLILVAITWEWLSVSAVMWLLIVEYALLAVFLTPRLIRRNLADNRETNQDLQDIIQDFVVYCKPLVIYSWVGFLYAFLDRWMLQYFGGSRQQGFFVIGQQFANVSLLATISILKVFWKEIAAAREQQNIERVHTLYMSISRGLFCASALISCFFIPYSRDILQWTVGNDFTSAWVCLSLMFIYPIHQTLGQIQGTFFYASEDTKTYANIGLLMMGVSIPITYFVLAPGHAAGLDLGAIGLALKLVILQIIGVNLQTMMIARSTGVATAYSLQLFVIALFSGLGWGCWWLSETFIYRLDFEPFGVISVMMVGGLCYLCLSGILLYRVPSLAGLTHREIRHIATEARGWIRSMY